jgi:large subunit ribosomal protein L13
MGTFQLKKSDALSQRRWHLIDANGQVLGRLATRVADILRGKHKAIFTPHVDGGDFVVVINARGIKLTGKKLEKKLYYRHSEYPGGLRTTVAEKLLAEKPETVVRLAVKGMLPKNRLSRRLVTKLKIYAGGDHPHAAQKPEPLALGA